MRRQIRVTTLHTTFHALSVFFIAAFLVAAQTATHTYASGQPNFSLHALAHSPTGLVSKASFALDAQAGTILPESVGVTNTGTAAGAVSIYPVTATTSDATGIAYLSKTATLKDAAAWIKLDKQQLTLAPGKSQVISFQVIVPGSAQAGQHLGGIVAENLTPQSSVNSGALHINMVSRTIIPIAINLPGPTIEHMSVTGVTVGGSNGYQSLILSLANTGSTRLAPTGKLKVSSVQGQLLQDSLLKMNTFLPNTAIHYAVPIQKKALAAGNYQASLHLNYGHEKTLDYTTNLAITQGQVNQIFTNSPLQAPTNNNAMPLWQIILVALAAIIILLIGGKKLYDLIVARRHKQKHDPSGSDQSKHSSKKRDKVA